MKTGMILVKDIPKEIVNELKELEPKFFSKDGNDNTLTAKDIDDSCIPIYEAANNTWNTNPAYIKREKIQTALNHLALWAYQNRTGEACMIENEITNSHCFEIFRDAYFLLHNAKALYDKNIDFIIDPGAHLCSNIDLKFTVIGNHLKITGWEITRSKRYRPSTVGMVKNSLEKDIPLKNLKALKIRYSEEDKAYLLTAVYSDSKDPNGVYIAAVGE